jgi:hypothetical protein
MQALQSADPDDLAMRVFARNRRPGALWSISGLASSHTTATNVLRMAGGRPRAERQAFPNRTVPLRGAWWLAALDVRGHIRMRPVGFTSLCLPDWLHLVLSSLSCTSKGKPRLPKQLCHPMTEGVACSLRRIRTHVANVDRHEGGEGLVSIPA